MAKKIGLFLDDLRVVKDVTWLTYPDNIEWIVVRNAWDFFRHFGRGKIDFISFDHDIQQYTPDGDEITGYDILKELANMLMDDGVAIPQCFFHTQNPIGKKNMEAYYLNAVKFQEENK